MEHTWTGRTVTLTTGQGEPTTGFCDGAAGLNAVKWSTGELEGR